MQVGRRDSHLPSRARESAIADAITVAEPIMAENDAGGRPRKHLAIARHGLGSRQFDFDILTVTS
jgi:hypothetical protein